MYSARTMLLVFGCEAGDSFRNIDRREVDYTNRNHVLHPTTPKFHRDRISFQNHQDGCNTAHTAHALSAGCGGNTSSRNTMLAVFNRGGPGSYRRREPRGVISQKETQILQQSTAHSQGLESAFSEQRSSLENHSQDKPSHTRLLRRRDMMSSRRSTPLSFS